MTGHASTYRTFCRLEGEEATRTGGRLVLCVFAVVAARRERDDAPVAEYVRQYLPEYGAVRYDRERMTRPSRTARPESTIGTLNE